MGKLKYFVSGLFLLSIGALMAPLPTDKYPEQEVVELEENQGFRFQSLKNRVEYHILSKTNQHALVKNSLDIFFFLLNTNYQAKYFSQDDLEKITDALLFACNQLDGQTLEDNLSTPSIHRSISVANNMLLVAGNCEVDTITASLLQDVYDDNTMTLITDKFGKAVSKQLSEEGKKESQDLFLAQKLYFLDSIHHNRITLSESDKKKEAIACIEMIDQISADCNSELISKIQERSTAISNN